MVGRPAALSAAWLAALAALAGPAAARADTGPAPSAPPCVGTGMLAVLAPGQSVPTAVGPSLEGASRQGTAAGAFSDTTAGTALTLAPSSLGVAGCTGTSGAPGGTELRAGAWSVLGGVVTATGVKTGLVPEPGDGSGWHLRARVDGLDVGGQATTLAPGQTAALGTWGTLRVQVGHDAGAGQQLRWWRAALGIHLLAAHAGFPAGTTLLVGWVAADRAPAPPPAPPAASTAPPATTTAAPPTTTAPTATTTGTTSATRAAKSATGAAKTVKQHRTEPKKPTPTAAQLGQPLATTPPLAAGTYDFPVYGQVSWGDTYGSERSDVPGGWHHGDDLFAPLGAPVLAVADGTVFAVGWNPVGGWRLWLRDAAGDSFYYAHLSGYTALARNGAHVRRGQVLAFVGNTGDADTTPTHLHFEVHPNELLYLGYNGAVDPTGYLDGWQHPKAVEIPPPVGLPSTTVRGQNAIADFRRLTAIRPQAQPASHTTSPAPTAAPTPAPTSRPAPPPRLAAGTTAAAARSSTSGLGAIAAAIVLFTAALLAVLVTAHNGRVGRM